MDIDSLFDFDERNYRMYGTVNLINNYENYEIYKNRTDSRCFIITCQNLDKFPHITVKHVYHKNIYICLKQTKEPIKPDLCYYVTHICYHNLDIHTLSIIKQVKPREI